ncbi:hypothetical protein ANO11243_085960 [Dothideomycetidae sp. 11243]|nr:hypothetical protein ANO11243_085960 [fungal sp. No.11243]
MLYTEEDALRYCPGGYHPVALGDIFKDGRYTIKYKLGFGSNHTSWLAWDRERKWNVSIRIMTADCSSDQRELELLRLLAKLQEHMADYDKYVVTLLDDFVHVGVNGSHQCLVLEFLGPSLGNRIDHFESNSEVVFADEACDIAAQVLNSLAWLHDNGIAHGGRNLDSREKPWGATDFRPQICGHGTLRAFLFTSRSCLRLSWTKCSARSDISSLSVQTALL